MTFLSELPNLPLVQLGRSLGVVNFIRRYVLMKNPIPFMNSTSTDRVTSLFKYSMRCGIST